MPITQQQREQRKNHLGSSDMPAIMGFSRFANAYDIWLLKTGRVQPKEKTEDYIQAGNLLERPVINWCEKFLGMKIDTGEERLERRVEGLPVVTHMDGEVLDSGEPVEVKTEGVDHPISEPWGEAGTDEVPEYTLIQAHCHLMATDREICHVPTFLGGRGFGYFYVKRDNKIVELIKRNAIEFWENHVLKDIPPENVAPSLNMIKQIRSIEGDPVELPDELISLWQMAKDKAKEADAFKQECQAKILAALDGREMGFCSLGDVTNFKQNRKGYTVDPTSFRVLRLKMK